VCDILVVNSSIIYFAISVWRETCWRSDWRSPHNRNARPRLSRQSLNDHVIIIRLTDKNLFELATLEYSQHDWLYVPMATKEKGKRRWSKTLSSYRSDAHSVAAWRCHVTLSATRRVKIGHWM